MPSTNKSKRTSLKSVKMWEDYEDVARHVLKQIGKRFGLSEIEGKQKFIGRNSETTWEIDAKGIREGNGAIVLIECRRYKRSLTQEAIAAVAYRILDANADGGITVSPLPLQKGAAKVAAASRIEHVRLRPESTRDQWMAEIGKVVHIGFTDTANANDSSEATVHAADGSIVERRAG